jgi:DNA-binding transcriptional LysR family regulator
MPSLRRTLSSLSALATFEAAARLASFTRAAEELGVTQAAVSRQIRALETDLNTALFLRQHRRVELTRAGHLLAGAVTSGFDRIAEVIETLRQSHAANSVTVGATLAFSHFWLLPRLTSFRLAYPDIQMRVISQDDGFDVRQDDAQIVIRYGAPPFAGSRVLASVTDRIFPVCSPAFRDRVGPLATDQALFDLPLIATDWPDPSWATWRSWAEAAGLGRPNLRIALRFTHYADTVYAAIGGEGVALGWQRLLSGPLSEGRLVRLGQACSDPGEGYHLTVADQYQPGEAAMRAIRWFTEEVGRTALYP